MAFHDWAEKKQYLPVIDYLKTDAAEAEILTGLTDRAEAAKLLYSWGAKEVLITHNTEVLAYDGERIYTCPIKARTSPAAPAGGTPPSPATSPSGSGPAWRRPCGTARPWSP